jgi:biotin synthase-related radical SAM superfamily protein
MHKYYKTIVYIRLSSRIKYKYNALLNSLINKHGNGNGVLISGIYREHFTDDDKKALRKLISSYNNTIDLAIQSIPKYGRMSTFRKLNNDIKSIYTR